MEDKMLESPKIEIINHFDELINQVDIDIETSLKTYEKNRNNRILADLECYDITDTNQEIHYNRILSIFGSSDHLTYYDKYQRVNLWTKSTKVVDYLNQIRMGTIEMLKKAQEETLEYYKLM